MLECCTEFNGDGKSGAVRDLVTPLVTLPQVWSAGQDGVGRDPYCNHGIPRLVVVRLYAQPWLWVSDALHNHATPMCRIVVAHT